MKKTLLSAALLFASVTAFSQITLIDENFDSFPDFAISGFGNWQTLDLDLRPTYSGGQATGAPIWPNGGDPQAFMIFNPTAAGVTNSTSGVEVRNFDPHSGAKYAAAWDAVPNATTPGNEDWLISPPIQLGQSGNELTFWVKSLSDTYLLDKYKVGVFVGSGNATSSADFTIISGPAPLEAPFPNWAQMTYPLDTYANQTVRIGIQCVSTDNYMLMVDDFKITAGVLSTSEAALEEMGITLFPNPTTDYLRIKSKSRLISANIYDMGGRLLNVQRTDDMMDVRALQTGEYIINLKTEKGNSSHKFIKK